MNPRRSTLLLLTLATMLSIAGCSELPVSPVDQSTGSVPSRVQAPSATVVPQGDELLSGASNTKLIRGLLGGTVSAGDFTVIFPPLAVSGTVTVTVTQADLGAPLVDLSIAPASANRFRLPVLLIANASRMDRQLLSLAYISYFNPATARWERVPGCAISLLNLTVTAPLSHFSTYRVEAQGKAGW